MTILLLTDLNRDTSNIIKAAIEVHRRTGPGLLESAYQACLQFELRSLGVPFETETPVPIVYKGFTLPIAYRLDLIVNRRIVVEVKSVSGIAPIHEAQMLTYLRLTGCPAGLILNFNVPVLKEGIKRLLNTSCREG